MSRAEHRQRLLVAIRQDLRRVAREDGYPEGVGPPYLRYMERGRLGVAKVRSIAGGWTNGSTGHRRPTLGWRDAVRAYGLTPAWDHKVVTREAVIDDLRRVAREYGESPVRMPSCDAYRAHGRYSVMTAYRRLAGLDATWEDCAEEAGLEPYFVAVTAERLIADYQRLAQELGYEPGGFGPTFREFEASVPYSARLTHHHCGSWTAMCEEAGFRARKRGPEGRRERRRELAEAREG